MNSIVIYSSRTGNTKQVAEAIVGVLPEGTPCVPVNEAPADLSQYDLVFMGFWADQGNADKAAKDVQGYDTDNRAMIEYLNTQDWYSGNLGAMGFCIGGHLAFRAALQSEVKATACFYATDLHTNIIPNQPNQHSMERLADIKGELMMIWGKQDNHIPTAGRVLVNQKLSEANLNFTWHEFNGQHAFMRDEGERYDPQLAMTGYQLAIQMFGNAL